MSGKIFRIICCLNLTSHMVELDIFTELEKLVNINQTGKTIKESKVMEQ